MDPDSSDGIEVGDPSVEGCPFWMKMIIDFLANPHSHVSPVHGDRRCTRRRALSDDEAELDAAAKLDDLPTSAHGPNSPLNNLGTFLTLQDSESSRGISGRLLSRIVACTTSDGIWHACDLRRHPAGPADRADAHAGHGADLRRGHGSRGSGGRCTSGPSAYMCIVTAWTAAAPALITPPEPAPSPVGRVSGG